LKKVLLIRQKTNYPNDYYPTVNIQINSSSSSLALTADFDTGTKGIFIDLSRLVYEKLIDEVSSKEVPQVSKHLGIPYGYYVKDLCIGIVPA